MKKTRKLKSFKILNKSNKKTKKKSVKIKQNKSTLDDKTIWGKFGSVYSPKKNIT